MPLQLTDCLSCCRLIRLSFLRQAKAAEEMRDHSKKDLEGALAATKNSLNDLQVKYAQLSSDQDIEKHIQQAGAITPREADLLTAVQKLEQENASLKNVRARVSGHGVCSDVKPCFCSCPFSQIVCAAADCAAVRGRYGQSRGRDGSSVEGPHAAGLGGAAGGGNVRHGQGRLHSSAAYELWSCTAAGLMSWG